MFTSTNYKGVKLKNDNYYINYRDETGVSRRKMVSEAKTAKEASALLAEKKAEVVRLKKVVTFSTGQAVATEGGFETVHELAMWFFGQRDTRDNKHEMGRYIGRVQDFMGHYKLPILLEDCNKLQSGLKRTVSDRTGELLAPKTINSIMDLMRAMFNEGMKQGKVSSNPFRDTRRLEVDNLKERYLTVEEVELLFSKFSGAGGGKSNSSNRMWLLLLQMAYYTGARPASFLELRLSDIEVVNEEPKNIRFKAIKKGKSYSVPVANGLKQLLLARVLELQEEQEADKRVRPQAKLFADGYLFPSSRFKGRALAHATVRDNIQPVLDELFNGGVVRNESGRAVCRKDGKERITLYSIRHTTATHLVDKADIYTASKILNHTTVKMTERYAKVLDKNKQDGVNALG